MAANTEAVANKTESAISELPFNNYTCANCDIKFDSESSLRVHLQYHGESFIGHQSQGSGPWLSTTSSSTVVSSTPIDTGLSPPPSSNNSNVDDQQPSLKPIHINNNLPSSYPNSTSAGVVITNTPTPPSSAEAISPSSVSSAATMISYEPLPSAIGPSHHLQQQSQGSGGPLLPQHQHHHPQQQQQQQQQQMQQQQLQHMQHMQQMQQQYSQQQNQQQGNSGGDIDYDIEASSSAEEIWDLDSHTVKRYNNASGDTSASSTGHGSMESPMGSYPDLSHPQQQHHYVPTNPMWGTGGTAPMYHQQQQHGFPSSSHELYGSNDWLHAGSGNLKRPGSNQSDEAKRIKTYQCEACDKWFTSSGHLKRHFNTTLHKNATRHQHKSGGTASPRIGTPTIMGDLEPASANSISNLNTSTSTLNSSPSPSSPHPAMAMASMPATAAAAASVSNAVVGGNNNVPNSPRAYYNSRNSSPMQQQVMPSASPVKIPMMNMLNRQPLPSMKDSMSSHIKADESDWMQPQLSAQRCFSNLYSPDSVSAVNRPAGQQQNSGGNYGAPAGGSEAVVTSSEYSNDLYNLQPPPPQSFNYQGHYNMEYSHTNGGQPTGNQYMMYSQQVQQPRGYHPGHHTSDMSNYNPHSEGSVKDELDQLSVVTGDLDEGLSETGTPATPTDSLEGPPTPSLTGNGGPVPVANNGGSGGGGSTGTTATGEYRCTECNKVFNRLCYLKQHNKSFHNGEKPFKCGQCGKRFPVEVLYQEHLAKHAGDKPYKCEVCPKQFNHKTDLRRHMCLHTGEKPFACEVCGKGFIREDRMVKHSDTHKKKQPILMT